MNKLVQLNQKDDHHAPIKSGGFVVVCPWMSRYPGGYNFSEVGFTINKPFRKYLD